MSNEGKIAVIEILGLKVVELTRDLKEMTKGRKNSNETASRYFKEAIKLERENEALKARIEDYELEIKRLTENLKFKDLQAERMIKEIRELGIYDPS